MPIDYSHPRRPRVSTPPAAQPAPPRRSLASLQDATPAEKSSLEPLLRSVVSLVHPRRGALARLLPTPTARPVPAPAVDLTPRLTPIPVPPVDYAHPQRRARTSVDLRPARPDSAHPRRGRLPRGATPASTGPDLGSAGVSSLEPGRSFLLNTNPDGSVVRFDPTIPITVRVNDHLAAPGAIDDVEEALKRIWGVSGLLFRLGGRSRDVPSSRDNALSFDPNRPEILVAWAPSRGRGASDLLNAKELEAARSGAGEGATTAGIGGWYTRGVQEPGKPWKYAIVHGHVVVDSLQNDDYEPGFGDGRSRGAVLLHELAHALGLDHVNDPSELMYPLLTGKPARYGRGDHEGLRRVGAEAGAIWR